MNDTVFWILTLLVIVVLIYAVVRIIGIEKHYKELLNKQKELEKKQSEFVTKISENIYEIVENTYKEVYDKGEECLSEEVVHKEKELLNVTGDLLEFLRIKSGKVSILHEKFNLNNVLNEVAGRLGNVYEGKRTEVIFDIDNTIPRYLIGDARNLEKALFNVLEFALHRMERGELSLEISMFKNRDTHIELQFKISDDAEGLQPDTLEKLFFPYYDEEKKSYFGLGLYVAKTLIELMGGTISVHSDQTKGTTFLISLPFELLDANERRNYRLPTKSLTAKKVFICDIHLNAALAAKKMFAYFRHEVTVMDKEEFLRKKVSFDGYDIVVLHPFFLRYKKIEGALRHLKAKRDDIKIVALDALLHRQAHELPAHLVDKVFVKPLTQERVFELIVNLFTIKPIKAQKVYNDDNELIYRGEITPKRGVTRASFADFKGMRLLIVEDDVINQKVLTNLLKESGIELTLADNGWKAVNIIKENNRPFDLVLMDINMPIMDGYTATQMIRTDEMYDSLPIVAFTALALEDEREKIFESGMNAFLTKPLDIGRLYTAFSLFYDTKNTQANNASGSQKRYAGRIVSNAVIDMRKGLRHANNNEGLYAEVLREFLDAYGKSDEVFATLVKEHRYEQLKLLLLDMKGLTATIGATDMFDLVTTVHQKLLYKQEEELIKFVAPYRDRLQMLRVTIEKYLKKEKNA